jgi:putative endonuclease
MRPRVNPYPENPETPDPSDTPDTPREKRDPRPLEASASPGSSLAVRRGRLGETLAAAYLELAGYRLLARNRRWGPLEVDLIAQRGDVVAFVEVRLRSSRSHGRPEDSLGWHKRANLERAARGLLGDLAPGAGRRVRFDVIAVEVGGMGLCLRHLPGWSARARFD